MTGLLTLSGAPTIDLHSATKKYVDDKTTGGSGIVIMDVAPANPLPGTLWWESDSGLLYVFYIDPSGPPGQWIVACPQPDINNFVSKTGDTMSGFLTLGADPTALLHAATKQYVDAKVAANVPPPPDTSWVLLTDAATIVVPGGSSGGIGRNFRLNSMGGNRTLGYLQTPVVGTDGLIAIKQDATGSRTLSGLTSNGYCCDGDTAFTIGTIANKWSVMSYSVFDATHTLLQLVAVNASLG
jgi:hypothetical protein